MTRYDVLLIALVALSAYLKSPVVAVAAVILCAVDSARSVFAAKTRDAEIMALVARADAYEKRHKELDMMVTNVAERSKQILGETY